MDLTVIIPTIGRVAELKKVVTGLNKQTFSGDFDIVIVNDGGELGYEKEIKRISRKPVRFVTHKFNRGRASACNSGIREVKTPIVIILDDDIVPDEGWLNAHLDYHKTYERERDVCFGKVTWGDKVGESEVLNYLENMGRFFSCVKYSEGDVMTSLLTGNTSFKTQFISKHMFNESFTVYGQEDLELGGRLFEKGMVCRFSEKAWGLHLHEIDSHKMCRLSFNDGYSAAHYFSMTPDRKWDILSVIAKNSDPGLNINKSLKEEEEFHTYKGADSYFKENSSYYREFMELYETGASTDLLKPSIEGVDEYLYWGLSFEFAKQKEDYGSAIAIGEEALNKFPHLTWLKLNLAIIYLETGQFSTALELLENLDLKWNPVLKRAVYRYEASIYEKTGEQKRALKTYLQLIDIGDNSYKNYFKCWLLKKELGLDILEEDYSLIVNSIEKCRHIDDIDIYSKASVLKSIGRDSDAKKSFLELLNRDSLEAPIRGGAFYHLGDISFRLDNYDEAELHLNRCLEFIPGHKAALEILEKIRERRC